MKTLIYFKIVFLLIITSVLLPCVSKAQGNQTNEPIQELVRGEATNGIHGEIEVTWTRNQIKLPEITIFVANTNTNETFNAHEGGTNWWKDFADRVENNDWLYYVATNSFCGPISMCDGNGKELSLLKPDVSLLTAYPDSYSLNVEHWHYLSRYKVYLGAGVFPPPLMTYSNSSQLAQFQLGDYFDIKSPGEYKLTVWPKIYERESTNDDICRRIDLPPVTVTIKWNGATSNQLNSTRQP